jgi:hypothetical protein
MRGIDVMLRLANDLPLSMAIKCSSAGAAQPDRERH